VGIFADFMGATAPWPADQTYIWMGTHPTVHDPMRLRLGELDGHISGRPEIVFLDQNPGNPAQVLVLRNAQLAGTPVIFSQPTPVPFQTDLPASFVPADLQLGDFDGDGVREILAISASGELLCFHALDALGGLTPCQ
jgi:hypothetical protein